MPRSQHGSDADAVDMAAVPLAPLTAIALNALLSGTAAAERSSKRHAQRSLLRFAVRVLSTVVERAAAAEHSPFVLFFDECLEPKSLPN